jgi:hypothetical protein
MSRASHEQANEAPNCCTIESTFQDSDARTLQDANISTSNSADSLSVEGADQPAHSCADEKANSRAVSDSDNEAVGFSYFTGVPFIAQLSMLQWKCESLRK